MFEIGDRIRPNKIATVHMHNSRRLLVTLVRYIAKAESQGLQPLGPQLEGQRLLEAPDQGPFVE